MSSVPSYRRRFAVLVPSLLAAWLFAACGESPTGPTLPTLAISAISPAIGSTLGGTVVTISGSGFSSDASVTIGGTPVGNVSVQSAGSITAVTPTVTGAGVVDVAVTSGGRTAALPRGFTFVAPTGANQPPVVASIRSVGTRTNQPDRFADVDETVTLIATVTDAETPASSLTFAWSGSGTFTGSGATVSWRVPSVSPTPSPVTVTLTVTEQFAEGGVTHQNTSSATFVMRTHDSQKEILEMGEDFLTLFSRSEVPTDQVLHNFSSTCDRGQGRAAEKQDVDRDRINVSHGAFTITPVPPATFNFGGVCVGKLVNPADACAQYRVRWEVTYKVDVDAVRRKGTPAITEGIDYVTAVYENSRWQLCHSNFEGVERFPTLGITRSVSW